MNRFLEPLKKCRTTSLMVLMLTAFSFSLNAQDCCDQGDKPNSLTLKYTGEGCSATNTSQDPGKYECDNFNGGPNADPSVYIIASENDDGGGKIYFTGTVGINETFTATSANAGVNEFKSKTYFNIYSSQGGTLLQRINMHTSCSAPIATGDQIGALVLESATFKNGVDCGPPPPPETCPVPVITFNSSQGTNSASVCADESITFEADPPGSPCAVVTWDFGSNATPQTATGVGPHSVTFDAPGTYTVTATIGNDCEGGVGTTVCPPPPIGSDCCESIGGKPKILTVMYTGDGCSATTTSQDPGKYECTNMGGGPNGDNNVYIVASEKEDGSGKIYFSGNVAINTTFSPNAGNAGDNEFKSKLFFRIFGSQGGSLLQIVNMHTSCSAPLVPGEQIGSILLESAEWDDGSFCDVSGGGSGSGGTDCCDQGDKPNSLTMLYTGEGCSATNTSQDPGKYECDNFNGGPNADPSVYIIASENDDGGGKIYFTGTVGINETFTATSANAGVNEFKSKTYFNIYSSQGGTLLQRINMHTSCSAPIAAGDQIGALVLESATFKNGVSCGPAIPPGADCLDCEETVTVQINVQDCNPQLGSLGDFVWNDLNQNGQQDFGEPGVQGIPVQLKDCNNVILDATVTNTNGFYQFTDLPAGCYRVGVVKPNDFVFTTQNSGNDATDSDVDPVMGMTGNINLGSGENDPTNDAGIYQPTSVLGKLGNFVWFDQNSNGLQDPNEPGIDNAFVMLMTCSGTFVDLAFTDANGMYMFSDLDAGCYRVFFANPNGSIYMLTTANAGDDTLDSDVGPDGNSNNVNLAAGETNLTIDAGYKPIGGPVLGSIGDRVFNDLNQNGVQDGNEPGVNGVTVQLKDCGNNVLTSTTTSGNGNYSFGDLTAGCYRIGIVLPGGFSVSPQNVGNDATDSDINPGNLMTGNINLGAGEDDPTNDAGIFNPGPQLGSIGDRVFNDLNQNGVQDNGEPGVNGVTVQLKDCGNNVLTSTTTSGNGNYSFGDLTAGCYRIGIVLPTGFSVSPQNVGNDATDSDINPGNLMTGNINLGAGEDDPTNDAGIFQDAGDPCDPISLTISSGNLTVTGASAPIVTIQVFDAAWSTVFTCGGGPTACTSPQAISLDAGDYCVSVKLYTAQWSLICEVFECITISGGNLGSIGDKVFNDLDQDGVQDPGEPGVDGVTVQLKDCGNTVLKTTTTAGGGFYSFDDLAAGCYRVGVLLPGNFTFTTANVGNDALDSDINPGSGMTGNINLAEGQNNNTVDAGLVGQQQPCDNVNFGGQVGFGGTCAGTFEICNANGDNGPLLGNCSSPSGGSGALEIIWLRNSQNCDPIAVTIEQLENDPSSSPWQIVPGATGLTFDPGFVSTTTCYQRCARRAGCTQYLGESNISQIIVNPDCGGPSGDPDCAAVQISSGAGSITVSGLGGAPVTSLQIFNSGWGSEFSCFGDCNATETVSLGIGTYYVKVKYYDASWISTCEVDQTISVNSALLADGTFNFEATKYDEHSELLWVHNNGEEVETYTLERSLDGVHFEEVESYLSAGGRSAELYVGYDLEPALGDNHYRVRLDLVNGDNYYSETKVLNFPDLVHVLLFPNPANEFVKANLEDLIGFEDVTITVYNGLGVAMKQFQLDEVYSKYYQMDIRDLREGHYIVWFDIPGRRSLAKQLVVGKR